MSGAPLREVVTVEAQDGGARVARLACGHAVMVAPTTSLASSAFPDEVPCLSCLCAMPKSPGEDATASPPVDSAGGSSTLAHEEDEALFGALHAALSELGAADDELDERFDADLDRDGTLARRIATLRAQDRVQQAVALVEGAWRLLGGTDGGGEGVGPHRATAAGRTAGEVGVAVLDVSTWPDPLTSGRITAALNGYQQAAGAYPDRVRMRDAQRDALPPSSEARRTQVCGIPLEVVDG